MKFREKRSERLKGWMLFDQQYRGANQLIFSDGKRITITSSICHV